MKNLVSGIIIGTVFGLIIGLSIAYFINKEPSAVEYIEILNAETFAKAYDIDSHIFELTSGDQIYEKMDKGESFILFIGRQTCPYCQETVPELNESAVLFGYDEIYYIDSSQNDNKQFLEEQGIEAVPFTAFVVDGNPVDHVPGFVDSSRFSEILNKIK